MKEKLKIAEEKQKPNYMREMETPGRIILMHRVGVTSLKLSVFDSETKEYIGSSQISDWASAIRLAGRD